MKGKEMNCPIMEQTADGVTCGRCWYHLAGGDVCERHGFVGPEVAKYNSSGLTTLENEMRKRKGLPTFPTNTIEEIDSFTTENDT